MPKIFRFVGALAFGIFSGGIGVLVLVMIVAILGSHNAGGELQLT